MDEIVLLVTLHRVADELVNVVMRPVTDASGLSLADYEVLSALASLSGGARPAALAAQLRWQRSRLSHQLASLERRGLVARFGLHDAVEPPRSLDRRGVQVRLTTEGRRRLERARPALYERVERCLRTELSSGQYAAVVSLAREAATAARSDGRGESHVDR